MNKYAKKAIRVIIVTILSMTIETAGFTVHPFISANAEEPSGSSGTPEEHRYRFEYNGGIIHMDPNDTTKTPLDVRVYDETAETYLNDQNAYTYVWNPNIYYDPDTKLITSQDRYGHFVLEFEYGNSEYYDIPVYIEAPVEDFMTVTDELDLFAGESYTFKKNSNVFMKPDENTWLDQLEFKTSDSTILEIDRDDASDSVTAHALKEGDTNITISSVNGLKKELRVHVDKERQAKYISLESAKGKVVHSKTIYLRSGETRELPYYLFDNEWNDVTDAASDEVKWQLNNFSDPDDAEFELKDNKITATGTGSAYVFLTLDADNQNPAGYKICVSDEDPEKIEIIQETIHVHLKDGRGHFTVNVYPEKLNGNVPYRYSSISDPKVISIDPESDAFNALRVGETDITVTTENGKSDTVHVIVDDGDYAQSIDYNDRTVYLDVYTGDSVKYEPEYTLHDGTKTRIKPSDEKVSYELSDPDVVSVTQNSDGTAVFTGVTQGASYFNASISNGDGISGMITVTPAPTSLHFNVSEITITDEDKPFSDLRRRYIDVEPSGSNPNLIYESSNVDIVTVDRAGNLMFVSPGDAVVSAFTEDGKLEDTIEVHCRNAVTPTAMTSDNEDVINIYKGYYYYSDEDFLRFEPADASKRIRMIVEDPDSAISLKSTTALEGEMLPVLSFRAQKEGNAKITIQSADDPDLKKSFTVHVSGDRPSPNDIGLKYELLSPHKNFDQNANRSEYTCIKGGKYAFKRTFYKNIVAYTEDRVDYNLLYPAGGYSNEKEDYSLYRARKAGTAVIDVTPDHSVKINIIDAEVGDPEIDFANVNKDLKLQVEQMTSESMGIRTALEDSVSSLNIDDNEDVLNTMDNLSADQKLKIETKPIIKYEDLAEENHGAHLRITITPHYAVNVTDRKNGEVIRNVTEGTGFEITEPVELSIPVGREQAGKTLYIKHVLENGSVRIYTGTVDQEGVLKFINPDGFSTFEIYSTDPSTVKVGNNGYMTLQDAIDEAPVGRTIKVLDGYEGSTKVIVRKETTFTLENHSNKEFDITTVDGCSVKKDKNKYSVKRNYKKEDDHSPAVWGNAHIRFSEDHASAAASRTDKTKWYNQETVDAVVAEKTTKEADCTNEGEITYTAEARFSDGTEVSDIDTVAVKPLGHDLKHVEETKSSTESEGNREYWTCARCGRIWLDADMKNETRKNEVMIPALRKEKDEGDGQTKVQPDHPLKPEAEQQYQAKTEGKPDQKENVDTGDSSHMNLWGTAFILSVLTAAFLAIEKKRRA